jgi:glycogen operon protein
LFGTEGRGPRASINFVTAHDGFTLRDLVSYEKKHNEANGERNRDGWDDNESQNCGVEGETTDSRVKARRRTLARSLMATLFLSQGVPMLEMGDELWRTQRGNNNPYCHDSELTWVDWRLDEDGHAMLEVVQALAGFRKRHLVFRRTQFFRGERVRDGSSKDVLWLSPSGSEMARSDWEDPARAALAFRLDGEALEGDGGEPLHDASFLVLINGERQETTFVLPSATLGDSWRVVLDTRERSHVDDATLAGALMVLDAGSLVVLTDSSPGV